MIEVEQGDRWVARPVLARLLRLAVFAAPLLVSTLVVLALRPLFPPGKLSALVLGLVAVAVAMTLERSLRRVLPLATLLRLTMLFPDQAPSRYKVARSAGDPDEIGRRLARDPDAVSTAEQVLALITSLGHHDRRTRGHSERVRVFCDLLAAELKLDQGARDRLRWASLLHDIGKLDVAPAVLNKPSKLDGREFALIKAHPQRGAELTAALLPWLGEWGRGILEHHERYDGKGYPSGLTGADLSRAGRIVCLVDAFETMTAARAYKKPMATKAAREELARCAGSHFDPVYVRAFLTISLPRLLWAMGPLSFLVQLPFLNTLAQAGSRSVAVSGQAATALAGAGAVATVGLTGALVPSAAAAAV
ncbi:MAG: domain/HD domain protein, partial [Frankiales bacterium]|nr:domain/HD domain protein [Frankiales bacterium]